MAIITIDSQMRAVATITLAELDSVWGAVARQHNAAATAAFRQEQARFPGLTISDQRREGPFKLRCLRRFCEQYETAHGRPPEVSL